MCHALPLVAGVPWAQARAPGSGSSGEGAHENWGQLTEDVA